MGGLSLVTAQRLEWPVWAQIWLVAGISRFVAVFGTTISPYLFFWQASQEAEDMRERPRRQTLQRAPEQGGRALQRIKIDTLPRHGDSPT